MGILETLHPLVVGVISSVVSTSSANYSNQPHLFLFLNPSPLSNAYTPILRPSLDPCYRFHFAYFASRWLICWPTEGWQVILHCTLLCLYSV
jgi:hypothetical protein